MHDNGGAYVSGWPFAVARLLPELLPVVGEGITGSPVIGPASMDCGGNGGAGPKVGVIPDAGLGYVLNKDATSCAGSTSGKPNAMRTENTVGTDHPAIPAVGHPVFADFAGGTSFLAPAAGLLRALDLAASEYQTGGEDYVAAWNPATGDFRPNFPVRMNDLQFLTGPSVADIDPGSPGEEMVAGSAYLDLQAYTGLGKPVAGFAQAHGGLDGRQPADRLIREPRQEGAWWPRIATAACSPTARAPTRAPRARGRASTTTTPTRARTTATPSRPGRPTATRSRARP